MSVSTDATICYGFACGDGTEFPWDNGDETDIEEWWLGQSGYVPKYQPYDGDGYAPGFSREDPRIDAYFKEKRDWLLKHPVPVELVNYCSDSYIIAVPRTVQTAGRGYPKRIYPGSIIVGVDELMTLMDFVYKYKIETDGNDAGWYLSNCWGV